MSTNRALTTILIVAALTLPLSATSAVAGLPADESASSEEVRLAGTVLSKISYQGRLSDASGNPLNGSYDLVFQLWDAAVGGQQLGSDIVKWNVPVSDGLFTVELAVPQDAFTGRAVWLQISIEDQTLTPRQELLPVPYALSLRPGATIASPGPTALHAVNEAGGYGLRGQSQDNIGLIGISGSGSYEPSGRHGVHGKGEGVGVYGAGGHTGVHGTGSTQGVKGESPAGNGVVGEATAADSSGVYGHSTDGVGVKGRSENGAGVVGWTGASDQSGVFGNGQTGVGVTGHSEENSGVVGVTTSSDAGQAGVWARNLGAGPAIFSEGDLHITGAFRGDLGQIGGAPFPRPAYDSGWLTLSDAVWTRTLDHNLGGSTDNYVIDLQFKGGTLGHTNRGLGGDMYDFGGLSLDGAFWANLTNQQVEVRCTGSIDCEVGQARLRIWVYR
jgi:hypothetical protein